MNRRLKGIPKTAIFKIAPVILLFSVSLAGAQNLTRDITGSLTFESKINWKDQTLELSMLIPVTPEMGSPAVARSRGEHIVQNRIESLFLQSLGELLVDSGSTVNEAILKDPALIENLTEASKNPGKINSTFDQGMKYLKVAYEYPLYPTVISPFISHSRPDPVPGDIRYHPTTRFTGILIYLPEKLSSLFRPSFFPALYDDRMDLLFSRWMIDPLVIKNSGAAGYDDDSNSAAVFSRVGPYPLYILAKGVYGKYPGDIIISFEDAQKIRTLKENRELLREGKVAVIFDLPE